jgi:rhodanese-related sulfurtransferase
MALLMGVKSISPKDLLGLVERSQGTVVDVNAPARFAQGHVPGARNLDHAGFAADALPADRDATLVFYCSNPMCRKAPIEARRAKAMGYQDARVMSAGISGWESAGMPTQASGGTGPG